MRTLKRLLLAALLSALPLAAPGETTSPQRPNIVLIVADDLGYADVGFNGATDIHTPHLDALARSGVRFSAGYATASVCSPSRAGLLSGRMQQRFGHEINPRPGEPRAALPAEPPTLPMLLRAAGYATGGVGKWHLGDTPGAHPLDRGFTDWFGFLGGGRPYRASEAATEPADQLLLRGRTPAPMRSEEYLTDVLTREAVEFVERRQAAPFFLYLAYNAPHKPIQATPKYLGRVAGIADERRRTYAAMVSAVDDGVGAVVAKLRELGLVERTLVVFMSDNGGLVGPKAGSSNGTLRGKKGTHYEGGIRVPLVMSWPGALPAGRDDPRTVSALDLLPTFAAIAGAPRPAHAEGVDLLPYLRGGNRGAPHDTLFWKSRADHAVRMGPWKWIRNGAAPVELYDLEADPGESKNLAAAKPDVAERARAAFDRWDATNVPTLYPSLRDEVR